MNKLTVLYDVVKKMKDRDSIKGTIKAEAWKDKEKVFGIEHMFEKSKKMSNGRTSMEMDCDGRKMKLENNIDFQGEKCQGHHGFFRHIHGLHQHKHPQEEHMGGFRGGWDKITAILGILSSVKLEEKEDGTAVLSLESANIPEEVKMEICEKMKQNREHHKHMGEGHPHHKFIKEFDALDDAVFTVLVSINKNREVEKVSLDLKGQKKDGENGTQPMKMAAELALTW